MSRIWETISAAPAEAWVGLIGVIFGSVLAILTSLLSNWSSRKQIKIQLAHEEKLYLKKLTKERLEELYSLASEWLVVTRMLNLKLKHLMKGTITPQQYIEAVNAAENKSDVNRMEMIIGIYGDSLHSAYEEVVEAREDMLDIALKCFESVKQMARDEALIAQLESKQPRLLNAIQELKEEIVKAAKRI